MSSLETLKHTRLRTTLEYDTKMRLNILGSQNTVSLHWVKAHTDTIGNKRADELAKAGSALPTITHSLPPPTWSLKIPLSEYIYIKWNKEYSKIKDCRQFKLWFPVICPRKLHKILSLTRPKLSLLCQWFTSFNNLGYHTKNKGEIYYANCRLCKTEPGNSLAPNHQMSHIRCRPPKNFLRYRLRRWSLVSLTSCRLLYY
jgi:hypothetical protein